MSTPEKDLQKLNSEIDKLQKASESLAKENAKLKELVEAQHERLKDLLKVSNPAIETLIPKEQGGDGHTYRYTGNDGAGYLSGVGFELYADEGYVLPNLIARARAAVDMAFNPSSIGSRTPNGDLVYDKLPRFSPQNKLKIVISVEAPQE